MDDGFLKTEVDKIFFILSIVTLQDMIFKTSQVTIATCQCLEVSMTMSIVCPCLSAAGERCQYKPFKSGPLQSFSQKSKVADVKMEEETSQMSHLGMNWTGLNLNLSLQEDFHNMKVEVEDMEMESNSTLLNRLDTGLVYEAVVQV